MPEVDLHLEILYQRLGEAGLVCEATAFPEFSFFGIDEGVAERMVLDHVKALVEAADARDLYQRHPVGDLTSTTLTVSIDPPRRTAIWRDPVPLTFPVLIRRRPEGQRLGHVPGLQVAAIAPTDDELTRKLHREVLFALQRTRASKTLHALVHLQRIGDVELRQLTLTVNLRTPRQAAQEGQQEERKTPVLEEVATDLVRQATASILAPAYELDAALQAIVEALTAREPRSVLLIGPSGIGKTAAVHELVRRRDILGLSSTSFWATSGARLVAGALGFGVWQERCTALLREVATDKAVLYLGNLIELTEVGKSSMNATGIAAFLRPAIARGQLLVIAECTPEQASLLERTEPQLLAAFQHIKLAEPSPDQVSSILSHVAMEYPVGVAPAALAELQRLHRRYGAYSPLPGRAVRFLRSLLARRQDASGATHATIQANDLCDLLRHPTDMPPVHERDVVAAFAAQTGLPRFMLDDEVPLDLAAAHAWFSSRLMGQPAAVDLVVDLLATIKAGLARPRRPIASLLFIGPTGVGKTEMAKNLAEFFFADRARLTRFDMSEYATPYAVGRLLGVGASEGLLTAAVRQQPFSVLLLDEVEKADASFFDLLLQVLGEGRLTDAAGRLADFSNAIVIMTSNLGAESFGRQRFGLGKSQPPDTASHFIEEVRGFLRPELFNRIDRIVPFLPLSRQAVSAIALRELDQVCHRDGIRLRGVELQIAPAAAAHLADAGYDERYGARPLKRVLERQLLSPLAEALNAYADATALRATVERVADAVVVQVRAIDQAKGPAIEGGIPDRIVWVRRRLQRLQKCAALRGLLNDIDQLTRQVEAALRRGGNNPELPRWQERRQQLQPLAAQANALAAIIPELEDHALAILYGESPAAPPDWDQAITAANNDLWNVMVALYALRFGSPDRATLLFLSSDLSRLRELAQAYCDFMLIRHLPVRAAWFGHDARGRLRYPAEDLPDADQANAFFARPPKGAWALILSCQGQRVMTLFAGESGAHLFNQGQSQPFVNLLVTTDPIEKVEPPEGTERPGGLVQDTPRRTFNVGLSECADHWLGESRRGPLAESVAFFTDKSAGAMVEAILSE